MQGHVSPIHCDVCQSEEKLLVAKTYCETKIIETKLFVKLIVLSKVLQLTYAMAQ